MNTEERLEKLERELVCAKRRNRWLLAVVGLAIVGVGLAWTLTKTTPTAQAQGPATNPATNPAKTVIRANKFILEDTDGKTRAQLALVGNEPRLNMYNKNGKIRVELTGDKDGSSLYLGGGKDLYRSCVLLTTGKDGPKLNLYDRKGKSRFELTVDKGGQGLILTLNDEKGHPRVWLSVNKNGPALRLSGEKNKTCVGLTVDKGGSGLYLSGEKGKTRAWLGVIKDGPGLHLLDEKGKVIWSAPR